MEQLPVASHILVVSHSGGKLPESNANALPGGEGDSGFANALAAQISAQDVKALATVAAGAAQTSTPTLAEAPSTDPASLLTAEQATQPLADVLSTIPLPQLPVAALIPTETKVAVDDRAAAEDRLVLAAGLIPLAAPTLAAKASPDAAQHAQTLPAIAAKAEAEPAIIAVMDKALPTKPVVELELKTPLMPTQMPSPSSARVEMAATNLAPATPMTLAVDVKVGTPGWDTAFSQRVAWAVTNQHQVAELRLNPPNLGPVEIRITISNDQATAMFVSPHASVRDSIEAALPRLREMLGESGLTLGNVNVSSQSFQQQQQAGQGQEQSKQAHGGVVLDLALDAASSLPNMAVMRAGRGLVDTFA